MKLSNSLHATGLARQKGVALIVSLLLLIVITLLSVTAMRSANLNTRITVNHQHKQQAFQAAENALTKLVSLELTDPEMKNLNVPGKITDDPETTTAWYVKTGDSKSPDLCSDLVMDYVEKSAPGKYKFSGFGLNIITHVYTAEADGLICGTNARACNRMQVALLRE